MLKDITDPEEHKADLLKVKQKLKIFTEKFADATKQHEEDEKEYNELVSRCKVVKAEPALKKVKPEPVLKAQKSVFHNTTLATTPISSLNSSSSSNS